MDTDKIELQSYRDFRNDMFLVFQEPLNNAGFKYWYNKHNWIHKDYYPGYYNKDYEGVDTLMAIAMLGLNVTHPDQVYKLINERKNDETKR